MVTLVTIGAAAERRAVVSGLNDWSYYLDGWVLALARWMAGARRYLAGYVRGHRGAGGEDAVLAVLMRIPADPVQARSLVRRGLAAWPAVGTRLYVGCDIDHPAVLGAAVAATGGDPRLRIVVIDRSAAAGRAECLDRLYAALEEDERRGRFRARTIVLEDAGTDGQ
jgi:bacteriophage N4 adsorption protein B